MFGAAVEERLFWVRHGPVLYVPVCFGKLWQFWRGMARTGKVRCGWDWSGSSATARYVMVSWDLVGFVLAEKYL